MSWTDLATLIIETDSTLGKVESDKLKLTNDEKTAAVRDVLDEFNGVRPIVRVTEIVGTGTRRYVLETAVAGWDAGFSAIEQLYIVTQPGTSDEQARELSEESYDVRLTADATPKHALFLAAAPSTSETLRIAWSLPHTVKDLDAATATSIGSADKQAFLLLVAAEFARKITCRASDLADHSMGLDQVDYRSPERTWRQNAKHLRDRAVQRLAPGELSTGAAGSSTEWLPRDRYGNARVSR